MTRSMAENTEPIDRLKRREFIRQGTLGIGSLALTSLLGRDVASATKPAAKTDVRPRAKNVIFLHMVGGPSQVDLFDPKPALARWEGKPLPPEFVAGQEFAFIPPDAKVMPSPYTFAPRGRGGVVMSELLPQMATVADEIAVIRGMRTDEINHGQGELFLHTGHGRMGRPAFGAWASYGLGSENEDLPAFVVLTNGTPVAGSSVWSSGFLPSQHQGVRLRGGKDPIFFLNDPEGLSRQERGDIVNSINRLNRAGFERYGDPEITARIAQYELAYRMQASVPDLVDIGSEPAHVLELYGIKEPGEDTFARNCLLARRLVETGVRFVQVFLNGWDHHQEIYTGLPKACRESDRACAALIKDLKGRGLLDETLVIWGGEFGRTPMVQDVSAGGERTAPGRDHHRECFTIWLAGGGIKGGYTHGATDEFGFKVVEDEVHVHDFQATALHLLGLDHERLTYRYQGRDFRLTDVHGRVVRDVLA